MIILVINTKTNKLIKNFMFDRKRYKYYDSERI